MQKEVLCTFEFGFDSIKRGRLFHI